MDTIINTQSISREKGIVLLLDNAAKTTKELGLFNGLIGISMCFFILSRITGQQNYRKKALRHLNKVQQSILAIDDLGYAEGLAGIGWAVEWLEQQGYIKANTDVVLEDIDDTIYTAVIFSLDVSLSLEDGVIGKALYFLYRMQGRNNDKRRYRIVCNLECLVFLSDEIAEKILVIISNIEHGGGQDIRDVDMIEIAQSLIILLRIFNLKINTSTARETIMALLIAIERYLQEKIENEITLHFGYAYYYLIYAYLIALKALNKKGFTPNSPFITTYLETMAYTPASLQRYLVDRNHIIQSNNDPMSNTTAQPSLLSLLNKVNALKNTCYGYEAFLLQ